MSQLLNNFFNENNDVITIQFNANEEIFAINESTNLHSLCKIEIEYKKMKKKGEREGIVGKKNIFIEFERDIRRK
jgi:hypothetical protein